MEHFTQSTALALIKTALESKAITLSGPSAGPSPQKAGERDAEYLKALLTSLQQDQAGP